MRNQLDWLAKNIFVTTLVETPPSTTLAIETCLAAVRRIETINEDVKKTVGEFESFKQGPVEPVLDPQATDVGGIKGGIQRALKILKIDDQAAKKNVLEASDASSPEAETG